MLASYIDSQTDLDKCVSLLQKSDSLAIDLEFDKNMFRYGFNLCLVQIKVNDGCFLIDPLSGQLDIKTIFPVLEDKSKQKIAFAFGEDLRLLHSLGSTPQNMLDLSTVAGMLDYPPLSLTNLIELVLGIQVRKSAQRSNWFVRPLTQVQLDYAADDVLYLHELRDVFLKKASEKGILNWIQQEIELLDKARFHGIESNELYRDKDKQGMTELRWHVFKSLVDYREELAKAANRPGYQMIEKEFLQALAKDVSAIKDWDKSRSMPSIKNATVHKRLLNICEEAMAEGQQLGLSDDKSAVERLSREDYNAMRKQQQQIEDIKTTYFKPVKQSIAEEFGENTAAFLLSSRTMENIITGNHTSIAPYRLELVAAKAKTLNLKQINWPNSGVVDL